MKVIIGSDHGGYELKEVLKEALDGWSVEHEDVGCHDTSSVDYPELAHQVSEAVSTGRAPVGVLVCGTGLGMSMAANRHPKIRAAVCTDCFCAEMTRAHNDANVLCLGGRVVGPGVATKILKTFLETDFEGGRHQKRIERINLPPERP